MHSSDVEQAIIEITVKNKGILRDEIIGTYSFGVSKIYFLDRHTMEHQWLALVNPEAEDFSAVTGNLKVSINVMGKGDEAVQLS